MTSKNTLKNAFTKVAGFEGWYKRLSIKDLAQIPESQILSANIDALLDLDHEKYIKSSNKFDLLIKTIDRSPSVKAEFVEFFAEEVMKNELHSFKEFSKVSARLFKQTYSLLKEEGYSNNEEDKKRWSLLDKAQNVIYVNAGYLAWDTDNRDLKKEMVKTSLMKEDSNVLALVVGEFGLYIGSRGFDVVSSLMKHSKEAGGDAFQNG